MLTVIRKELWPGVSLTAVHTDKFKSSMMSVNLLAPLREETAAENALIPYVLRRGTAKHLDMQQLSAALDELYGGEIEPAVRKEGETQAVGFWASVLDDAYTPDGSVILEPAARLMGELLLEPYTEAGAFCPDYTAGEKENLLDRIRGIVNEKQQYSIRRLSEEMCPDEDFRVGKYGSEARVEAITPQSLWARYQALLAGARVELYYCGSAPAQRVEAAFREAFAGLPRGERGPLPACQVRPHAGQPRLVEETMEVTQGKLALGFRTGGVNLTSPDYPALAVFNALYGGTTSSRLFLHVREKLSLCYFASSMLLKIKGVLMVSSGIEFDKFRQARDEILAQLEACRTGAFEDWELDAARSWLVSSAQKTLDSQGLLEDYWLVRNLAGVSVTPEEFARQIQAVTRQDVVRAANLVELDTTYFLKGVEQ